MGAVGIARTTLIVSATYWESKAIEVHMSKPATLGATARQNGKEAIPLQQPIVVPHRDENRNTIYRDKDAGDFEIQSGLGMIVGDEETPADVPDE